MLVLCCEGIQGRLLAAIFLSLQGRLFYSRSISYLMPFYSRTRWKNQNAFFSPIHCPTSRLRSSSSRDVNCMSCVRSAIPFRTPSRRFANRRMLVEFVVDLNPLGTPHCAELFFLTRMQGARRFAPRKMPCDLSVPIFGRRAPLANKIKPRPNQQKVRTGHPEICSQHHSEADAELSALLDVDAVDEADLARGHLHDQR